MTAQDIINTAQAEVGTTESPANSNRCKYNDWFYQREVSGANYPWCCVFVSWVFAQHDPMLIKKSAGCVDLGTWFKNNNAWHSTPQVGDVVFFKFDTNSRWTNHVGIVKEVHSDYITTIEGNTSMTSNDNGGAVMVRQRSEKIVGYGRPSYEESKNYIYGVDVSEIQGNINFCALKDAGISFMSMRSTKKSGNPDAYFEQNLKSCIEHGIDYSCYKYSYAVTAKQAIAEAQGVVKLCKEKMFIWYDVEDSILIPLGKNGIEALVEIFAAECGKNGFEVGIYCNKNWYDKYISQFLKDKYKFWIARYGKNTGLVDEKYKPNYGVAWQYTSKGRVPGITGDVDRSILL